MRACNAEAGTKNLAGDVRQRFMSGCLSGSTASGALPATPVAADSGGRFGSEAQAKRACGPDPVVWANPEGRAFHAAGTRFYGKAQQGGYMCQAAAEKAGYRLAGGSR